MARDVPDAAFWRWWEAHESETLSAHRDQWIAVSLKEGRVVAASADPAVFMDQLGSLGWSQERRNELYMFHTGDALPACALDAAAP